MRQVVIVGGGLAGLAGLRTAEALRAGGYERDLTLVAGEPHPPYDRPLRGRPDDRKWAACWLYEDHLIAMLTVDRPRDLVQGRRIMAAGGRVDPVLLADPEMPVRNAVPS